MSTPNWLPYSIWRSDCIPQNNLRGKNKPPFYRLHLLSPAHAHPTNPSPLPLHAAVKSQKWGIKRSVTSIRLKSQPSIFGGFSAYSKFMQPIRHLHDFTWNCTRRGAIRTSLGLGCKTVIFYFLFFYFFFVFSFGFHSPAFSPGSGSRSSHPLSGLFGSSGLRVRARVSGGSGIGG